MRLIAPDVLAEAKGLSPSVAGAFLLVAVLVWLFGWDWHRFWGAAVITAPAGLLRLYTRREAGTPGLGVGLPLALAARPPGVEVAPGPALLGGRAVPP